MPLPGACSPPLRGEESLYQALLLGVRDYVRKNGFNGVVLGLSGGIDSALTLVLAVDALGKERVEAVLMPSRYTAKMSVEDACTEAENLGVEYHLIPIEPVFTAFTESLQNTFA
ncbi:MAG TPA: NAD(+) synthase, partial [Gammaproteobacteria bacterium]|nr:NAD(+) synthase [Gammaproteobacteria bacterium]